MRTIFGIITLSLSLAACMGDLLSANVYPNTQFTGSWAGEVSGVRITLSMDTATCEWGCSNAGIATFVRSATGDSGTASVSIFYNPGVPSQSGFDINLAAFAPDDTQLQTSLHTDMPDASHLVGHIGYDDLLHVDTGTTVTFTRK